MGLDVRVRVGRIWWPSEDVLEGVGDVNISPLQADMLSKRAVVNVPL
jgi:hypothetical protein